MTRQVMFRSPPVNRRQPLLTQKPANNTPREKSRIGEVAGGTAAECTAICCCCPFTVMNLLVLAFYKVPAGLCRKALKKRKRQRITKKKTGLLQRPEVSESETKGSKEEGDVANAEKKEEEEEEEEETESVVLEKEMWDRFYGTGFWRSPSQKGT